MTAADLPTDLDPGIVEVVRWLNAHGFETCDSGDGRSKFAADKGPDPCAMAFPNVAMIVAADRLAAECDRLRDLLAHEGVAIEPIPDDEDFPAIQGTYDPANQIASILLLGVDDERLRGARPPGCSSSALLEARATSRLHEADRAHVGPEPPVATSNNLNLLHGAAMRAEEEKIPCVIWRGSLGWNLYCPHDKAERVVAILKEEAGESARFLPYPTAKEAPAVGYPEGLQPQLAMAPTEDREAKP